MMSSSPKLAAVEAFEYHEPGTLEAATTAGAAVSRATPHNGTVGRDTSESLELKLAAARTEGIQEGLLQAQQSSQKELVAERAKVAEAIHAFAQKTSEYY